MTAHEWDGHGDGEMARTKAVLKVRLMEHKTAMLLAIDLDDASAPQMEFL